MTQRITINGIVRNKALNEFQDGDMQEIINMRFREGAWRPIPGKKPYEHAGTIYENAPLDDYKKMWIHVIDTDRKYIGLSYSNELCLVNLSTGEGTVIETYSGDIDVHFIKRMMIVTGDGQDVYIWSENAYMKIDLSVAPWMCLYPAEALTTVQTGDGLDADGLIGQYRAKIYELSNQNYMVGTFAYRFAWKLYDGSYIMHTIPIVQKFYGENDYKLYRYGSGTANYRLQYGNAYKLRIDHVQGSLYDNLNDNIVTSLCVFISKAEEVYQVDTNTITDDLLATIIAGGGENLNRFSTLNIAKNDNWKKLADSKSWYLVHEVTISELKAGYLNKEIDIKGFLLDYASRETLPVDHFTHHQIGAKAGFVYNDRMILGNTRTQLGNYNQVMTGTPEAWGGYSAVSTYNGYLRVNLKTDSGEKQVYTDAQFKIWNKDSKFHLALSGINYSLFVGFMFNVLGYQDARAVSIDVILSDTMISWGEPDTFYWKFGTWTLKKSENDNYSYFKTDDYGLITLTRDTMTPGSPIHINEDNILYDENRVQVSELRNPLVNPARNSYQVGSGEIIGFGANTEPLSTGQYGEFPLSVFTSKGVWALMQGQGDVVFSNLAPAGGEVSLSKDQIVSVGSGVVFTTTRGVQLMAGLKIVELSSMLEGRPLLNFQENIHYQHFISQSNLVNLLAGLSTVSLRDYLFDEINGTFSRLGFDKKNNELYITNDNFDYSYVFNFESNTWHKVNNVFKLFMNDYPDLIAISGQSILNLSVEYPSDYVDILLTSQPQSIALPEVYKKMERSVLRADIYTGTAKYLTFAVFGSNDLRTWQFITGGQRTGDVNNILLTRSHGSLKWYIFVICSNCHISSNVSAIDITITPKLNMKLRK